MSKLIIVFILLVGCSSQKQVYRYKLETNDGQTVDCNQMNNYYGLMVFEECSTSWKYVNPKAFKMTNLQ